MIPNTAEEEPKARARQLNIYKHLAKHVGGVSSGNREEYLCHVIIELCMGKTPQNNKPSVVDCYYVWCEINDISLQDESLGGLFPSDEPSPDQRLRNMFQRVYDEVHAEHRRRERKRTWLQQKSLRNVLGIDQPHDSYKEYLESLGEE